MVDSGGFRGERMSELYKIRNWCSYSCSIFFFINIVYIQKYIYIYYIPNRLSAPIRRVLPFTIWSRDGKYQGK